MGLKQPACPVRLPVRRASVRTCCVSTFRHAPYNYSPPPLPCSLQPISWPVNVVVLIDGVEYPFTDEKAAQVATALQMITPAFKWTAAAQQVGGGRQLVGCRCRVATWGPGTWQPARLSSWQLLTQHSHLLQSPASHLAPAAVLLREAARHAAREQHGHQHLNHRRPHANGARVRHHSR